MEKKRKKGHHRAGTPRRNEKEGPVGQAATGSDPAHPHIGSQLSSSIFSFFSVLPFSEHMQRNSVDLPEEYARSHERETTANLAPPKIPQETESYENRMAAEIQGRDFGRHEVGTNHCQSRRHTQIPASPPHRNVGIAHLHP